MNLFDPAAIVNAVLYVDYTGVPGSLGANEQIYMNMTINQGGDIYSGQYNNGVGNPNPIQTWSNITYTNFLPIMNGLGMDFQVYNTSTHTYQRYAGWQYTSMASGMNVAVVVYYNDGTSPNQNQQDFSLTVGSGASALTTLFRLVFSIQEPVYPTGYVEGDQVFVEEQRELQNELDEVMEEIVHEVIIDNNEPITSMSDKTKRYTKENKQRALDGSIFLEEEKYQDPPLPPYDKYGFSTSTNNPLGGSSSGLVLDPLGLLNSTSYNEAQRIPVDIIRDPITKKYRVVEFGEVADLSLLPGTVHSYQEEGSNRTIRFVVPRRDWTGKIATSTFDPTGSGVNYVLDNSVDFGIFQSNAYNQSLKQYQNLRVQDVSNPKYGNGILQPQGNPEYQMFFAGQATLDKLKKFRDKHPGADLFKNRELYYYLHQYETNGGIIDRADTPDLYALKSLSENDGTRVDVKASYLHQIVKGAIAELDVLLRTYDTGMAQYIQTEYDRQNSWAHYLINRPTRRSMEDDVKVFPNKTLLEQAIRDSDIAAFVVTKGVKLDSETEKKVAEQLADELSRTFDNKTVKYKESATAEEIVQDIIIEGFLKQSASVNEQELAAIKDSVIDWVTGDGRNVVAAALSGYLTYYVASGTLLAVFGPYLAIPASFMLTSINAHLLNGILGAPARLAAAQGQYVNGILGGNDPNDALQVFQGMLNYPAGFDNQAGNAIGEGMMAMGPRAAFAQGFQNLQDFYQIRPQWNQVVRQAN